MKERDFLDKCEDLDLDYDVMISYIKSHIKTINQRKKYSESEKAIVSRKVRYEKTKKELREFKEYKDRLQKKVG